MGRVSCPAYSGLPSHSPLPSRAEGAARLRLRAAREDLGTPLLLLDGVEQQHDDRWLGVLGQLAGIDDVLAAPGDAEALKVGEWPPLAFGIEVPRSWYWTSTERAGPSL